MPKEPTKTDKQFKMKNQPKSKANFYSGSKKLEKKVAIVTGGDSGIGRAIAILFAREGANVVINYKDSDVDAKKTKKLVEAEGGSALLFKADVGEEKNCQSLVKKTLETFKDINILINNAAEQHPKKSLLDISKKQLLQTFNTNFFAQFYLSKAVLPYLQKGDSIINTTSVTAYRGSHHLIDYSATKGAIVSFTRSLALSVADQGIRVNAVAPGPIWTPLIPSTFNKEKVEKFGEKTPMNRPGQPEEVAPCFVFLASKDAQYITGQVLHPNGGEIINT